MRRTDSKKPEKMIKPEGLLNEKTVCGTSKKKKMVKKQSGNEKRNHLYIEIG